MESTRTIPLSELLRPLCGDEAADLARRDRLSPWLARNARPLTTDEIEQLKQSGCRCGDWSDVMVCDPFTPDLVRDVQFFGKVRLGSLPSQALDRNALAVPMGITKCTLVHCDIGREVSIYDVGLLARTTVGNRCILRSVVRIDTESDAHFGQGAALDIAVVNENGRRAIHPFAGMRSADAVLQMLRRDDGRFHSKLSGFTDESRSSRPGQPSAIGDESCVVGAGTLSNIRLGPATWVEGAASMVNVTVCSCQEAPVHVGQSVSLRDGVVGPGSEILSGATARRFVLGENVKLDLSARVTDSAIADNSTIACCEVASSLVMGSHEQHHNNSFLIAACLGGQSNIAAGATIGSNHNSRAADGEIHARRGFWPGLCTSLKHNSRFASYTLLAKGSYPAELDIPLPFSLVSNDAGRDQLLVMPAYWWIHNMYALVRNSRKIQHRDRRRIAAQPVETDAFAPDTAEEMLRARRLLAIWAAKAYLGQAGQTWDGQDQDELERVGEQLFQDPDDRVDSLVVLGESMENSRRPTHILKARRAWHAYRQMLHFYAGSTLLPYLEARDDLSADALHEDLAGLRQNQWINLGGQLVLAGDLDQLADEVRGGTLVGWDDVHGRLDEIEQAYPQRRRCHAVAVLRLLAGVDHLSRDDWSHALREFAALQRIVADEIERTRRKDDQNPFRASVYRNRAEMQAVLGSADSNEFVRDVHAETETVVTRVEGVLNRL